ncbi:MAG: pyridoxamine 5'-phosphate oxidase family protein [Actinomycetota bacterium]
MALTPDQLGEDGLAFLAETHLASLTTTRPDGQLHVVPVAYSYVPVEHTIRIVAPGETVKVKNAEAGSLGALCFVDGGRWMSLHGPLDVQRDPTRVADTVERYTSRYGPVRGEIVDRVSLELRVELVRGRFAMPGR